jgi:Transposase DDE domain
MFLRSKIRRKDGKEHRAWSVVENRRVHDGRVVQRQVFYLGEINDSQRAAWSKAIEVFDEGAGQSKQIALFPEDRLAPVLDCDVVSIRLNAMRLRRPRQWGACWMATLLWDQLRLDEFWLAALPPSREGTRWLNILKTLVSHQLISPGSEWRLHRHWFEHSAMGDLLGENIALVQPNNLYRCLDKLTAHKQAMFTFLCERWQDLFQADFEVLLYDLTSTYFECDPPEEGKRKFGYSRDKRSDCVQVVIALIVTPDGFPLAYEVMGGNTSDKTTLKEFLAKIEKQYGKAKRTWVMDRGIPTEEVLAEMRNSKLPVHYLVGSPRGRLTQLEKAFLGGRARERAGQIDRTRGRDLCPRSQSRPARQGAIDAPVPAEKTDQASARTATARPDARRPIAQTRRGQEGSGKGLRAAGHSHAHKGSAGHIRNVSFRARPQEIAAGTAARRQLFAALQSQER